ncbi:MAG: DUF4915 domain-containing protein [Pyrinomonadaceae bacterium]
MKADSRKETDALWARHNAEWRDAAQVTSQWQEAAATDPQLLRYKTRGAWWETLAEAGITLLVTREYEHMVMALSYAESGPHISYMRLPHPSGLAFDRKRGVVHLASTRNPNQVYELAPVTGDATRLDVKIERAFERVLIPVRSQFLPGSLYLHDLAMVGNVLHGNAVGENAVVRLKGDGRYERVWWPRAIEIDAGPIFGQNYLQLNSIAAGKTIASSYFSASTESIGARRPGHKNFPVKGRGVIFSGETREPLVRGLTRPHSARLHEGRLWVDNSGYGELALVEDESFTPVVRLQGWTRGLCFHRGVAFVGTSRVIPRFQQYAPGLDVDKSLCGVHAVDVQTGRVLGSLTWPYGNQIFSVEWLPREFANGFPFAAKARRALEREKKLFYSFTVQA